MKTIRLIAFMAICLVMAACGSGDDASKVSAKIEKGQKLTEADYTVMVDYCGKYATEAQKLQDRINMLAPTSEEAGKLTDEIAALAGKYPYTNVFFEKISNCTQNEVGAENVVKINELAPLTWFTAPEWADAGDNADVEGDIVDMPANDSAGVIASGDGEMVDSAQNK